MAKIKAIKKGDIVVARDQSGNWRVVKIEMHLVRSGSYRGRAFNPDKSRRWDALTVWDPANFTGILHSGFYATVHSALADLNEERKMKLDMINAEAAQEAGLCASKFKARSVWK